MMIKTTRKVRITKTTMMVHETTVMMTTTLMMTAAEMTKLKMTIQSYKRVGDGDYDQDYDDDDDADDATIATTRDGFSMDARTKSIIHFRNLIIPFPLTVPPLPPAKEHDFNRLQCRID